MNELSIIFNKMGIDIKDVLKAASTKWNFLNFTPGLVGGHCIGVDPYYLTFKAEEIGYHPQVILSGRRINDSMGKYIAQQTVKLLMKHKGIIKNTKIIILGVTFKENIPDVRNSRVKELLDELVDFGIDVIVSDPNANESDVLQEFGKELTHFEDLPKADAIILAVPNKEYLELGIDGITQLFKSENGVFVDVKYVFDKAIIKKNNLVYWSL